MVASLGFGIAAEQVSVGENYKLAKTWRTAVVLSVCALSPVMVLGDLASTHCSTVRYSIADVATTLPLLTWLCVDSRVRRIDTATGPARNRVRA